MNVPLLRPLADIAEPIAVDVPGSAAPGDLRRRTGEQRPIRHGHYSRRRWGVSLPPRPWSGPVEGRAPADPPAKAREADSRREVGHRPNGAWRPR
ncbi:hypothetical protein [uncultured Thermomonospora sp.]|uniref:hypothetical protein n=1 Tax=uncultured Thermomonospora sp. TaxID=671175 RepID=UPI00259BDA7B|nr:hypothetical protein [uncultured Thermomonospora sp.]